MKIEENRTGKQVFETESVKLTSTGTGDVTGKLSNSFEQYKIGTVRVSARLNIG